MSTEAQLALIGAMGSFVVAVLPLIVQYARLKGVAINAAQEEFIRDAAIEGVHFAEEYARKQPTTGSEKLLLASQHAQRILTAHRINIRLGDISARVEAALPVAIPNRPGPSQLQFPTPKSK